VPLAAVGIVCLGLVPVLGGPDRPLHWAMTAGMVGFGSLLWARRRLTGKEAPLSYVSPEAARAAGRAVLLIAAVIAALVAGIVSLRVHSGLGMSGLSLLLPALGLAWLAFLGVQILRHRASSDTAPSTDRPSRRPARQEGRAATPSTHPEPPDRRVSV